MHLGGDEGARTPDLGHARAALSQLSYIPRRRKVYHAGPGPRKGEQAVLRLVPLGGPPFRVRHAIVVRRPLQRRHSEGDAAQIDAEAAPCDR